jgi:hypothetical protein
MNKPDQITLSNPFSCSLQGEASGFVLIPLSLTLGISQLSKLFALKPKNPI